MTQNDIYNETSTAFIMFSGAKHDTKHIKAYQNIHWPIQILFSQWLSNELQDTKKTSFRYKFVMFIAASASLQFRHGKGP